MPYRGLTEPRTACALHPAAEAVAVCRRCATELCEPCTLYFAAAAYCRHCIARARRAELVRIGSRVALVLALMASATWLAMASVRARPPLSAPRFAVVRTVDCQPDRWLASARAAVGVRQWRAALDYVAQSEHDCGSNVEQLRLSAVASTGLDRDFAAIAAAVRYTDEDPGNPRAWQLRCEILAHFGHHAEARDACERAAELDDRVVPITISTSPRR